MVNWRVCRGCESPVARVCRGTAEVTDPGWLIVVVRCGATMASQHRAHCGGWNGQICSVNVPVSTSRLRRNRNEAGRTLEALMEQLTNFNAIDQFGLLNPIS